MLFLKEKDKKGIVIILGENELYVSFSRLQIKKLDKSVLSQLKQKFLKHLFYNKAYRLEWIDSLSNIFETKEKNSSYMDTDYIYDVLGIKLFHFHSFFMYELGEKEYKIEI